MTTTLPTVLISGASEELTARIEHLIRGQAELSLLKSVTPDVAANEIFKAKLIWIELESDPEHNVALLEQLIKTHPNTFFVVSKEDLEPELVKRTMQVGALDFLDHKGWAAQIRSVVRRIMAKEFGSKPNPGSPMSGTTRQPTRPSSWGQLNSLKVTVPPNSGFKRVEPGKTSGLPPTQQAQSAPAPVPQNRAPQVVPEPAPIAEVQEEPSYTETPEYAASAEGGEAYAEGEGAYTEGEGGYAEGEGAYAEGGSYAEGEAAYAAGEGGYAEGEGAYAEGGSYAEGEGAYAAGEGGYAEGEGAYAEGGGYAAGEGGSTEGGGYAEGEGAYAVGEAGSAEDGGYAEGEGAYAEGAGYAEGQGGYAEGQGGYAEGQGGYAEGQGGYAEGEGGYAEGEGGYAEGDFPVAEADAESEVPVGQAYAEGEPNESEFTADENGNVVEPHAEQTSEEGGEAVEEVGAVEAPPDQPKVSQPVQTAPGPKGRWDELDSIISTSKPEEKKAPSKWGDLGNIQTVKAGQKDAPAPTTGSKWSDLDTIGAKPSTPDAPAAKAANKWGDLDAIASKTPGAPAAGNKWGDLDALGAKISEPASPPSPAAQTPSAAPSASKWSDLDSLGSKTAASETTSPTSVGNKWGDLDAIASGGAKSFEPTQPAANTSAKQWGDLDSIGSPKEPTTPAASAASAAPAAEVGNKWGNLDALGGKTSATKTNAKSFIKPKAQSDAPATTAKAKWGDLAATDSSASPPDTAQGGAPKWGNLDAIGSGMTTNQSIDEPATDSGDAADKKWGNLNAIPTPKSAQDPSGNWGDLMAIPTPKVGPDAPVLIEGVLPSSQISNDASQKWKAGMSSDISTGARQVGEMRDKLKGKKVEVKLGWQHVKIPLAIVIVVCAGFLSTQFFPYPVPKDTSNAANR